jgi:uncharacterized membrane protein YgdD (TMEM256/DUF423 family)
MHRPFLTMAAWLGALAVALGAFGAHGLSDHLQAVDVSGLRLGWWHTAAHYHLSHALALGLCAATAGDGRAAHLSRLCFTGGIGFFSGTLYLMALTGERWLGAVTPIGGALLIVAWLAFGLAVRRTIASPTPRQ